nr:sigma-70 family RNA polymerase sigma factor [Microlunatus antarcticus]
MTRARPGDDGAVNLLVAAVRRAVHAYARSRLSTYSGGAEVAEDVAQDVCLAVVDLLPRYQDHGAPFGALVYAIASNKVVDAQRRYARTPYHLVDELPDRPEPAPGPETQAMTRSDVRAALALLDLLPPRTARVVRLRAEGLSAEEVGAVLGMSANAVRVTQHRALARIRLLVAGSAEHRERFADRSATRTAA